MNPYMKEDLQDSVALFRKNFMVLIITVFSYAASYTLNVYLARILTPYYYGNIALVLQLLSFFVPIALFGTELSMVRYISLYLAREELDRATGFLKWGINVVFITSLIILSLGTLVMLGYEFLTKTEILEESQLYILYYSFWLIPIYASINFLSTFLQVLKHYYMSAVYQGASLTVLIILSVYFLSPIFADILPGDVTQLNIILCIGAACVLMILIEMISLRIFVPAKLFSRKPVYEKKQWLKSSFQMMGSSLIYGGLMAIDIFMVKMIAKNEAAVGFFASITVIASSITVFGAAVDMILNPRISFYVEKRNKKHLQDMLNLMNTFKLVPAVLFILVVSYFGHSLLYFFGKDFTGAYTSLLLLAASFFIGLCFSSSGPLLTYSKHQGLSFKISASQLIYIVILDFVFIPKYGVMGAVIVLGSSIFLSALVRVYYVRKYLGVKSFYFI